MHPVHTEEVPPNRLRELLTARDMKLVDVAALCRVDQSTAWRWQRDGIPRKHVARVAEFLAVSVPYLDGWVDEPNGDPVEAAA